MVGAGAAAAAGKLTSVAGLIQQACTRAERLSEALGSRSPIRTMQRNAAWMWLGGLMGAIVVLTITYAGPRIGPTATVAVFLVGQFAAAVVVDRYGLFGLDRIAVGWPRIAGLALLAVGTALVLKR